MVDLFKKNSSEQFASFEQSADSGLAEPELCRHWFLKYPPIIGKVKVCLRCGNLQAPGGIKSGDHTVRISGNHIEVSTASAPANPSSGLVRIYATDTTSVRMRDSAGTETLLTDNIQALGSITGATTVNLSTGNLITATLTGNVTFTFNNPVAGTFYFFRLTQDAIGSRLVTWPTIKWLSGVTPVLTTTASKADIVTLFNDGTSYFGTSVLNL